jgi:D-sedoheptulose 7-phosphate isomerase
VQVVDVVVAAFRNGNKLMLFGNGGSAADAQHIAAEFTNRFRIERPPLPALALTTDSSALTAIGDYVTHWCRQIRHGAKPAMSRWRSPPAAIQPTCSLPSRFAASADVTVGLTGGTTKDGKPTTHLCCATPRRDSKPIF